MTRTSCIGPFPHRTAIETESDSRTGTVYRETWEGTLNELLNKQRFLVAIGAVKTSITKIEGGHHQLVATSGDPAEPPTDTHELMNNACQPEVWGSPKLRSLFTDTQIAGIKLVANKFRAQEYEDLEAAEIELANKTGDSIEALKFWRQVALHGVESFQEYNSVYRRTITSASPRQVQASWGGVGKIWTTAEVVSWERIPPNGWFILPSGLIWLKSPPDVQTVAYQKTTITYTYISAATASKYIYDKHGTATLLGEEELPA